MDEYPREGEIEIYWLNWGRWTWYIEVSGVAMGESVEREDRKGDFMELGRSLMKRKLL